VLLLLTYGALKLRLRARHSGEFERSSVVLLAFAVPPAGT